MIPEDWEAMAIADLFRFLRTTAVSRSGYVGSGSLHCVHYGDLHTKWQTVLNFSREAVPCVPDSYLKQADLIQDGDLIIADASEDLAGVGACAEVQGLTGKRAIGGLHTYVLRPQPAEWVRGFTSYVLQSTAVRSQIERLAAGLKVYGISKTALKSVVIPWPSKGERKFIAEALSDMDEAIECQEAVITKKRALKTATVQALLSGTRRLPGFSGEWEDKPLRDVAQIDRDNLGASTAPTYEFRYISLEDIDRGILRQTTKQVFAKAPSRARRRVASGDVLFGTVRPNLQSHLLVLGDTKDLICSTGFAVIRCDQSKADPRFVFFNLFGGFVEKQIERLLAGSNYPAISNKDVADIRLKMPDVAEQSAIAEVIYDMDDDLNKQVAQLEKLRKVKAGMMQQLLTGKIRLL